MGATAVVDENNKVTGIITDGDIRRLLERTDDLSHIKAASIMCNTAITIGPDALALTAFEIIKLHDISQLIITDNADNYLGMLHLHDLIREGIM